MNTKFYTNYSKVKFIDKLKKNIDTCESFSFSVSFIKKAGLKLIAPNIESALSRGVKGRLITSTYQNFTDVDSLKYFYDLQVRYPDQFACRLDRDCFRDFHGNVVGFHSKGYLFDFGEHKEFLVGSTNLTVYALLKNIEWDVSIINKAEDQIYSEVQHEFEYLWERGEEIIDSDNNHKTYN